MLIILSAFPSYKTHTYSQEVFSFNILNMIVLVRCRRHRIFGCLDRPRKLAGLCAPHAPLSFSITLSVHVGLLQTQVPPLHLGDFKWPLVGDLPSFLSDLARKNEWWLARFQRYGGLTAFYFRVPCILFCFCNDMVRL